MLLLLIIVNVVMMGGGIEGAAMIVRLVIASVPFLLLLAEKKRKHLFSRFSIQYVFVIRYCSHLLSRSKKARAKKSRISALFLFEENVKKRWTLIRTYNTMET